MTKTDLVFPAFSSRFVDFAVQFCFHCKFSFNEERRSSQVWQWHDFLITTNHDSLLRIATNEISSFWINHRSRQMAFLRAKEGQRSVVRTLVTHSATPCVPLICSYHILTSSVIYHWTDATQHGIYLLTSKLSRANLQSTFTVLVSKDPTWQKSD